MNRPHRSIEIFTMSALDLFITAMGSFAILMMILFPYYKDERKKREADQQGNILFCAWPTRVQDYEQFKKETEPPRPEVKPEDRKNVFDADSWKEPGYEQEPNFPVVMITWTEAQAFCQWLTKKERASKAIDPEDEYRLPTLAEWRAAMGPERYPWGKDWPPPKKFGNFGGEEYSRGRGFGGAPEDMTGYEDDHELASPVGSYTASRDGLYDIVGNVRTWTQDAHQSKDKDGKPMTMHNWVGAAWDSNSKELFTSDWTEQIGEDRRFQTLGFRCVLVIKTPPPPKP